MMITIAQAAAKPCRGVGGGFIPENRPAPDRRVVNKNSARVFGKVFFGVAGVGAPELRGQNHGRA